MSGENQASVARLTRAPARGRWPRWHTRMMMERDRARTERMVVMERLAREQRQGRRMGPRARAPWPRG